MPSNSNFGNPNAGPSDVNYPDGHEYPGSPSRRAQRSSSSDPSTSSDPNLSNRIASNGHANNGRTNNGHTSNGNTHLGGPLSNVALEGAELRAIGKDLLESDHDRGAVLISTDGNVLYSSPAARNHLRDGTPRGRDPLLPASIDHSLMNFVERMHAQRSPALEDIYYPNREDRRLRVTLEAVSLKNPVRDHTNYIALRVHPATPWNEPTVRRLQSRFGLTLREAQVAAGVSRGSTNAEVAKRLGIVEKTVKNVLMSVFTKCRVRNRVELALRAYDAPVGYSD